MTVQLRQPIASAVSVAPPSGVVLGWRSVDARPVLVASPADSTRPALLSRLTPAGIVAYCMIFPVISVGVLASSGPGLTRAAWAVAGTAIISPLYLRHVLCFIRGAQPPAAGWSLAAMAVVTVGAVPLAGGWWLAMSFALAVCLLIALPWRWSLPAVALVVLAQVPLALAFPAPAFPDAASEPAYFALDVLWRAAAVFVPAWLVRAVRQLEAARRELAEDAVSRERLRVDAQLRATLGAALGSIVAHGERAAALAPGGPDAAGPELAALIETSRGALAQTRQLLRGLHQPSLRAELETAASLLNAAGIRTRLELPADPPGDVSPALRSQLRSVTARLLRDESARTCVLALAAPGGHARLDVMVDDEHLAAIEVTAP
jgi:hypothetical protein